MADTKITYDISDAISKLNQLNKRLGETADATVEAFSGAGSKALDGFIDLIGDLSPTAAKGASAVRGLAAGLGPLGLVAGAAAAGLASVVANLVDMPDLLADNEAGMEALTEAMKRQVDINREFGDIGDAAAKQAFERAKSEARVTQGEANARRVQLAGQKADIKARLDALRTGLSEEERIWKDSAQRLKTLQDRLRAGQNASTVSQVERGAGKADKAVGDLAARAQQEAMRGNLDLAEDLRDRAQELAGELGGHVFFQKQVDAATQAITANMEKQVAKEQAIQKTALDRAKAEAATAAELQKQLDIINKLDQKERDAIKLSRAGLRSAGEVEKQRSTQDTADEAAQRFLAIPKILEQEFARGGRSAAQNFADTAKDALARITGGAGEQTSGTQAASDAFKTAGELLKQLGRTDLTARNVQTDVGPLVENLNTLVGTLKFEAERGTLKGRDFDISQLERILKLGQQSAKEAETVVGAQRSIDDPIAIGMKSMTADLGKRALALQDKIEGLTTAANRNTDALNNTARTATPGTTAPAATMQQQQQKLPAGVVPIPAAGNITVNANVKGGIIDAETTRTITDIIRKELRKETMPKTK